MTRLYILGLTLLAVIASMLGIYSVGRKAGKKSVELQQKTHALDAIRKANVINQKINGTDTGTIRKRLFNRWTRK
tara:strand:+ start:655 stop:879 length:225 start_codon:yes stop_codon:yes gene_type:complete